ncbi:hypothetical protein F0U59_38520 [Archangium gephyra]|nr:hypothetical protein F0U59_38520 [Archangium gephyra]
MRRLFSTLSSLSLALCGTGATARNLPNYEVTQDLKPALKKAAGRQPVTGNLSRVAHMDEERDLPTFVWASQGAPSPQRSRLARMSVEDAALLQLQEHVSLYGAASVEASGAQVSSVSRNARGAKVVTFAQKVGGHEIFNQSLKALLNSSNELVALSGSLSPHVSADTSMERLRFGMSAAEAISTAYRDLTGGSLDATLLARQRSDDKDIYSHYELVSYARPLAEGLVIPARVKQVFYPMPDALLPAFYVELNTGRPGSTDSDYYSYVVSAVDGRLLFRNNLTAHAEFSYRAFAETTPPYTPHDGPSGSASTPHPTGNLDGYTPPFVAPALITLQNAPFSRNDPWLPDGATVTTGNNVDAYADLAAPDGFTPSTIDLRPTVTAPGVFDRTMLFDIQPNANAEQIAAATTQLFFVNNWLHDWFYDAGFDEASANAQTNNFGRGGRDNDAIRAEAQDYSGTNNANMSTPADGASPRMQMYVFTGKDARLTGLTPASVAGVYEVGIAAEFGPQTFDVTGEVVVAEDGTAPANDGCTELTNASAVAGKIAIIDRGNCDFTLKVQNAQTAGATGVIIADNVAGSVANMGGASTTITIPTLRVTLADGNKLRGASGVTVQLRRQTALNLDGTVDNGIVAHEWGHYISNRLVGNAAGLSNNQGRSMGEGWGDFHALLMIVRAEDINVAANANWSGAYAAAEFATRGLTNNASFFGIRRGTYSVDRTKNALSFRHIMNGVALPTTAPFLPNTGVNSQVHNSGEIWATMLWECYVRLLRAHPFQEAQDRMKSYLVTGYKMTPNAPTYLEARDAIIAAARANDPADAERLWQAFASRGAGVGAVAPPRTSTTHAGLVESFEVGTNVDFESISLADDLAGSSCDSDGILDNGETGQLRVKVRNSGATTATATTITVLSSSRGVTLGNGGTASVPAIPAGGMVDAVIPVSLSGAATEQRLDFTVALRDANQAQPGDKTATFTAKGNYNELPNATTTETVEAKTLPWTFTHDTALANADFSVVQASDLSRSFFGPNPGGAGDVRLTTPLLQVGTEPFIITFKHAYDFETDNTVSPPDYYDGAIIEVLEAGTSEWVDVGSALYAGSLYDNPVAYPTNGNPLKGKRAIVGRSAGYPALTTATLNLGTAWAGKTVQVRFRIGSDNASAGAGWVLDDLQFSGLTNKPFTALGPQTGVCGTDASPVASAGPDLTVNERTTVNLTGTATDPAGKSLLYNWTQLSGPTVTLVNPATLTPSFTAPNVTADSVVVLQLAVSNDKRSVLDTVNVTIRNVNRAPTVNAGVAGVVNERATHTLMGSSTDADGDVLAYRWAQTAGTPVALSNADKLTASFVAPELTLDELLTFSLTVTDGRESVSSTVNVTVRNVNRAPTVNAGVTGVVDERSRYTLTGSASDVDGDSLTYAWRQTAGTAVTLGNANTLYPTFTAPEVMADETLAFELSVSDGKDTVLSTVEVLVKDQNREPTLLVTDLGADERRPVELVALASDPDGNALSYHWTQLSGTPVALQNADSSRATFVAGDVAADTELVFQVEVSDGQATLTRSVTVTVRNVNREPQAQAGTTQLRTPGDKVQLDGSASVDADGDAVTYEWTQVAGPTVSLSGADTATPSFTAPEVEKDTELRFSLVVRDGSSVSSASVVSVLVTPVSGCSSTGAGAPMGLLGLGLLSLLRRRRLN